MNARLVLLNQWGAVIEKAARRGILAGGRPLGIRSIQPVCGPRAGALELDGGLYAGLLLTGLQQHDGALLRQFVPWDFPGDPSVFLSGRAVRVEAGWPSELAESDIPLESLGHVPTGGGRWLVGKTEMGSKLTAKLDDRTPHWLVSGTTGSGKTTALVSAVSQLSRDPKTRLVLIDAKHGASLRRVAHVRGLVGPLAGDVFTARAALQWCVTEMARRYTEPGKDDRKLVVVIDEAQDLTIDDLAAEALRRLVVQGRGAFLHVVLATQHPVISSLGGPTVGRNLVGRLALKVMDAKASEVAIGASDPRADRLQGCGDGYAVAPGVVHRVQVAYLACDVETGEPDLVEWPEATGELPETGWPSGGEVGCAVLAANAGVGRVKFVRALEIAGLPGTCPERAVKLLNLGRAIGEWLTGQGWGVRSFGAKDIHETGANGGERAERVYQPSRTNVQQYLAGGVE